MLWDGTGCGGVGRLGGLTYFQLHSLQEEHLGKLLQETLESLLESEVCDKTSLSTRQGGVLTSTQRAYTTEDKQLWL